MPSSLLTSHLLSLSPQSLLQATTHPFLSHAATASLPRAKLIAWLAQDRLYALSYINFIGSLLAQLHIPTSSPVETPPTTETKENGSGKGNPNLPWDIASGLIDCLTNIRREILMFERTAREEGFLEDICGVREERATRSYRDLFAGATAGGKLGIVGLVVLWGSEVCYLRAWRFAASHLQRDREERGEGNEHGDRDEGEGTTKGDVMQRVFIPNWSDVEFETFVGRLGHLVDLLGEEVQEGGEVWRECEEAWRQVLWCEGEFWPEG